MRKPAYIEVKPSLFVEHYVSTKAGEPYRLLPFGKIGRPGLDKLITPEFARKFKLPHFKPPIKLGSHNDETPAGGHIIQLEVRDDGLYAIPEMNESGESSIQKGEYRYHSPEIIWEDEGIFDAAGNFIQGPLILGDAFLHTPHLGEAAALYGAQVFHIEQSNLAEEVTLSEDKNELTLIEKLLGNKELAGKVTNLEAEKLELADQVTKLSTEKADLEGQVTKLSADLKDAQEKLAALDADKEKNEAVAAVKEVLGEVELDDETVTLLSTMDVEQRDKLVVKFKALHEQAKLGGDVEQELGSEGAGVDDPSAALDVAVKAKMKESGKSYIEALEIITVENPDLYQSVNDSLKGGK